MPLSAQEIQNLLNSVDEKRLVKSLCEMIEIPSVNPFNDPATPQCRELEFAEYYQQCMEKAGLQTSKVEVSEQRPNVMGYFAKDTNGPCMMLAGHLDTVGVAGYQQPFVAKIDNQRIYGRGSCDMKAALAAYIEVATILKQQQVKLNGTLLIVGMVDEEHKMAGSKHIYHHGPLADCAIIGEPTELKVCHAHKGQICMHIRTFGQACHSSVPENGINAIHHMADVIKCIEQYSMELGQRDAHETCGRPRVNAGIIEGGTISSTVPDFCQLEVDRRTIPGETTADIVAEYEILLQPLVQSKQDFKYEIGEPILENPPLNIPKDTQIVSTIVQSFEQVEKYPAKLGALSGATDAPNLRCPTVVCGPGSIKQAHTTNEYVEINQLISATKIYLHSVLKVLA